MLLRIVILQGSPNIEGSTSLLVENFTKGAIEAGHDLKRYDIAKMNIHSCGGCVACGYEGPCIVKDDNETIRNELLSSDMIVLATPLYYYGFTSQLKKVIDRFCSYNSSLNHKKLKSALLTVAWNSDDWTFDAIKAHYKTLVKYCNFNDQGMILGYGCGTPSMTKSSKYMQEAYDLGRRV